MTSRSIRSAVQAALFLLAFALSPLRAAATEPAWCAAERLNPTEATICTVPLLGELDAEMTTLYRAALHFDARPPALRRAQQDWLQARDACDGDPICVAARYRDRIEALDDHLEALLRAGAAPTPDYALTSPAAPIATPPDWCAASALNPTEHAICASPLLTELDAALAEAYGAAMARADDPAQIDWLIERNRCAEDAACIEAAYRWRIVELTEPTRR